MTPFDHVKNLHTKKRRWEDFNDEEKKSFNIYFNLLPNKFTFYKWIKGEKTKKEKEKAEYLAMHFKVSIREAYDYLKILDRKTINSIIKNYKNDTSRKAI